MLEDMWQNWGIMHYWWSCELIQPLWMAIWNYAQRVLKHCLPLYPATPLLSLYPKEIIREWTCTKTFLAMFFVVAKILENALQLGNGWTNCSICWWWNTIVLKGIMNWRNSMWTEVTSRNWCRVKGTESEEPHTQRWMHYGIIKFSTSSNAMTQDISEGHMRKNAIRIQRKNCGSRNKEGKQLLDHINWWGFVWGYRLYFFLWP